MTLELNLGDDWQENSSGALIGYKGQTWGAIYPVGCSQIQEMIDWLDLGFYTVGRTNPDGRPRVFVYGDVPEYLQKNLRDAGVELNLIEERTEHFRPYGLYSQP